VADKRPPKTNVSKRIPVLATVTTIIKKYRVHCENSAAKNLFPVPSNQKLNAYLNELADVSASK
jgi:hypothetical protein